MNINARIAESNSNSLFQSPRQIKNKYVPVAAGKTRKNSSLFLPPSLLPLPAPPEVDSREAQVVADRGRGLYLMTSNA